MGFFAKTFSNKMSQEPSVLLSFVTIFGGMCLPPSMFVLETPTFHLKSSKDFEVPRILNARNI